MVTLLLSTLMTLSAIVCAIGTLGALAVVPRALATEPAAPYYYIPPMPHDMAQVDFYLITSGVGDEVANRFGHTGVRIHDRLARTDVVFNWGKFSFDAPFFLWKFFRGELTYSMGVKSYKDHVEQAFESKRRVWQDQLNLTVNQKQALMSKIALNALPENRPFSYQYWYKNCATIPRDYLDDVLDGAVRSKFHGEMLTTRYRDYVRGNLQAIPFVVPTLDIFMNGNIDKPISAWQDMFLPVQLRDHLLAMPAIDDHGEPIAGRNLLEHSQVLLPFDEVYAAPFNDYLVMVAPIALPLLSALMLWALARVLSLTPVRRDLYSRWAYRTLGLGLMLYGLVAGLYGLVMALNWGLSGHPDAWANLNMLLFWPVDLIYAAVGWRLMRSGRALRDAFIWPRAGRIFTGAHLLMLGVFTALTAMNVIQQDVWPVLTWFGGLSVFANLLLLTIGLRRYQLTKPYARSGDVTARDAVLSTSAV